MSMSHATRQRFYFTYTLLNCVHVTRHKAKVLFHLHTSVHVFMSHDTRQWFHSTYTLLYMCSCHTPQGKSFIPPTHLCTHVHVTRHKATVLFHLHTSELCSCHTPQGKGFIPPTHFCTCVHVTRHKAMVSFHLHTSVHVFMSHATRQRF